MEAAAAKSSGKSGVNDKSGANDKSGVNDKSGGGKSSGKGDSKGSHSKCGEDKGGDGPRRLPVTEDQRMSSPALPPGIGCKGGAGPSAGQAEAEGPAAAAPWSSPPAKLVSSPVAEKSPALST